MFCKKCGNKNDDDAVFCNKCGLKFKQNSSNDNISSVKNEEKSSRKTVYQGEINKCPNCGDTLESFETICSSCGHEIRSSKLSKALEKFSEELQVLEAKRTAKSTGQRITEFFGFGDKEDIDKQVINLIKNYVVPNNFEDLLEFLILACSNIDVTVATSENPGDVGVETEKELNDLKAINNAWLIKASQVYQKASISSKGHSKFSSIESIYLNKINEINEVKVKETKKKKRNMRVFFIVLIIFMIGSSILIPFILKENERLLTVNASSNYYVGKNFEEVILELEDVGFENLVMKEIEILSSDTSYSHGDVIQISFNGITDYEAQTEFSSRTKVEITYYVIKYTINVHVDFEANLMFSKYDVNFLVNGEKKGTLTHGSSEDFKIRIRAGENKITFSKIDDSDIKGSINITVNGDVDVTYKISAFKDKITVEDVTPTLKPVIDYSINKQKEQEVIYSNYRRRVGYGYF